MSTFSIRDSGRVSLVKNPFEHMKIFFTRKDTDFFPTLFLPLCAHTSLNLRIMRLIVRSISSSLSSNLDEQELLIWWSNSSVDGQLRKRSSGRFVGSALEGNSGLSSFCNFLTFSGVKSDISGGEEGSSPASWLSWIWLSFNLSFPKVPMASNVCGQSLNSSPDCCLAWWTAKSLVQ